MYSSTQSYFPSFQTDVYNPNSTLSSFSRKNLFKSISTNPSSKNLNSPSSYDHRKSSIQQIQASTITSSLSTGSLKRPTGMRTLRIRKEKPVSELEKDLSQIDTRRAETIFSSTQMTFIAAPETRLLPSSPNSQQRFTPFSTILQKNSSWINFAKKNPEELGVREMMRNQLMFNQTQKSFLVENLSKEQSRNVDSVIQVYKQHENKINLPKIRIKTHSEQMNAGVNKQESNPLIQTEAEISESQQQQSQQQSQQVNEEEDKGAKAIRLSKLNNLRMFWYNITDDSWRPEAREFPSISLMNGKLYMYGGMGNEVFNTFTVLDLQNWKWKVFDTAPMLPEGRYGHSSHVYKKDLLIFGGEKKYNSHSKVRTCYNDIQMFSFVTNTWSQLRTFGDIIEGRRNHTSILINKFLFVYGGINTYNKHLNDVVTINLESFKCNHIQVEGGDPRGLAFQTMTAVFRGEIKMENPHFPVELKRAKDKKQRKVKEEGIYIFGGLMQNSEATNQLRVLKLGSKPLKWIIPDTRGTPPLARYQHAAHYYEDLNMLIVYGGRNDNPRISRNANVGANGILGDVCILDIETLNWISVEMCGLKGLFKCAFSSILIDSKILVFGGQCETGFVNSNIYVLELDQSKNRRLLKESLLIKNSISVTDILLNHSDLFDMGTISDNRNRQRQSKLEDDILDAEPVEEEHLIMNMRSYQPLPKKDLLKLKPMQGAQGQSSIIINIQNTDRPKFKHNQDGIPSLNTLSEDDDDDSPKAKTEVKTTSKKNKKVSYAVI